MKKNTDPRITTTQLKFSTYLNVVAILICICASYLLICLTMVDKRSQEIRRRAPFCKSLRQTANNTRY